MTSSNPLVSVCIGVYNRERYIRECLDSVFAQTYKNLEVIVVDDASTDGTVDIIQKEYGDRVRLFVRDKNSGLPAVTRNEAARSATGEYLAFLDSDDLWMEEKLALQVAYMKENRKADLCHGYAVVIDKNGKPFGVRHDTLLKDFCFRDLLVHCFVTLSSVMVRRSVFERLGGFDERMMYRVGEDNDFFLRVARTSFLGLCSEKPVAFYRKSPSGITAGAENWKRRPEDYLFLYYLLRRPDVWKGAVSLYELIKALHWAARRNFKFYTFRRQYYKAGYFFVKMFCIV